MALAVYDRVRETTTTTGTGTITLLGAVVGYQTFDVVGNGNTTYYTIAGQGTTEWEVGIGTFTLSGTTLARTTVLSNSLGTTAPVSFSAGTKDVFVTYPSEKAVYLDASGNATLTGNLSITGTLGVTGVATLTAKPILSSLTASLAVFSDASKGLVSNAITGTGNVVMSASPTLTGTAGFAALTASADSAFNGTGALQLPVGTTGQQPTGAVGKLRYNSTTNEFEGYSGSSPAWKSVGGSAISNDTTTATDLYPIFAAATTGTALNVYTSNAKYLYKPSTGELQAPEILANNGLIVNNMTIATSYSLPAGYSASSVGPVVISGGVVVTVPSGSRWVVL